MLSLWRTFIRQRLGYAEFSYVAFAFAIYHPSSVTFVFQSEGRSKLSDRHVVVLDSPVDDPIDPIGSGDLCEFDEIDYKGRLFRVRIITPTQVIAKFAY